MKEVKEMKEVTEAVTMPPQVDPTDNQQEYEIIILQDGKVKKVFAPRGMSAKGLAEVNFPKRHWLIDGVIPPGLVVVIADYKTGKTICVYQLSIAVATGGTFLGRPVRKGKVVYFDLESSFERAKERLEKMGADMDELEDFIIVPEGIATLRDGLEDQIIAYKHRYPDLRLVVVDTLSKVYPNIGEKGMFMEETKIYGSLRHLAQKLDITLILIHHKSKMNETSGINPLSLGYGSNALPANSDVIVAMSKKDIADSEVRVIGSGNDIESFDIICQFKDMKWSYEGSAAEQEAKRQKEALMQSTQYRALCMGFQKNAINGVYIFRPSDLIRESKSWTDIGWLGDPKTLAKWIRQHKAELEECLKVEISDHRKNGGVHFTICSVGCAKESDEDRSV